MVWPMKTNPVSSDLVMTWYRKQVDRLNTVLNTVERSDKYSDEYIYESIKEAEVTFKQMRKFIDAH